MKVLLSSFIIFILLLNMVATVSADTLESPPKGLESDNFKSTTTTDPVRPLQMGVLTVVLEKTTLSNVASVIGVGELTSAGDASEYMRWLCYTISTSIPKQRIWLSSGELAGGDIIDLISATQLPANTPASKKCPELPVKFKPLTFTGGIWLGATSTTIKSTMGKPGITGNTWSYIYIGKDKQFDVIGSIDFELSSGKAKAIHMSHATSY